MILFLDVVIIVGLFFLFGLSHTVLASRIVKQKIADTSGDRIAFFRLFYNVSSIIIFILIWIIAPKPSVIIYDLQYPFDLIIYGLQIVSLGGFLWAGSQIDLYEFLGVNQIKRFMKNNYNPNELDEISKFTVKGAFKYSRHPIYFFSILFLGFRPTMDLFYLTAYICIVIYFIVGSIYEERKMVIMFGDEYISYQRNVPRFIPFKIFK
ncbi:MAG: hypothetical protein K9J12_03860 [Melioribacteraceae bacterium]|nr:hypothetical protein [Melioribacteraceae bacterium]MCF8263235.1 hypothetical protein [Melioribacteraceae bacterium]MCF8431023.1 hypothetical protein [Melioribacteraceae bacterium]